MPNEYARSGFHSGETASGYFDESFSVHVAGTNRTAKCEFDSLQITETDDDAPNTLDGNVHGFTPSEFQEIKVFNGGVDVGVPLFIGNLLNVAGDSSRKADRVQFPVHAVDPRWLIDRYALVTKHYASVGVGSIVADILANYTNGGFTLGYVPMTLGNPDITFTAERVSSCLARLAKAVGATARVYYTKRVSIAITHDDEGNSLSLTDSSLEHWGVRSAADGTQIRTRVIYEGGGSNATATMPALGTTIDVEETGWYSASGGTVRAGLNFVTYTGVSTASGPGTLTGCSGIAHDIPQGEPVNVYVQADDSAAQTALAALLGGGLSGIAVHYLTDGRLSADECQKRADAALDTYTVALKTIQYTTTNAYTRAGRSVTVNITKPQTINTTLAIQTMTLKGRHMAHNVTNLEFDRVVTAAPRARQLHDVIATGIAGTGGV